MGQKFNSIEDLFRQGLADHSLKPSARVLRTLRFNLWKVDFFSLNLRKFNIAYALLLFSGIVLSFNLINQQAQKELVNNSTVSSTENSAIDQSKSNSSTPPNQSDTNKIEAIEGLPVPAFEPSLFDGCAPLKVTFHNTSKNAESYYWVFGNGESSVELNPEVEYSKAGIYTVELIAKTDYKRSDVLKKSIRVFDAPKADFDIDREHSDITTKQIAYKNNSKGATSYLWLFGDEATSRNDHATHSYANYGSYKVKLIAFAENGCSDTTSLENNFLSKNYELSFPVNFRPSTLGSENNGFYEAAGAEKYIFYPKNFGAQEYEFKVIAPNGIVVFTSNNIKQGWNGYIKGRIAPGGAYTYTAKGVYPNGKRFDIKGTFDVIVVDINGHY